MKNFVDYQRAALGKVKAELVLKNGFVVNVFTEEIIKADVAICGDTIVGVGSYEGEKEIDCTGKYLAPGLIDAHIHIESTMALPSELSRVLLKRGTTTIIADPHELVNVKGKQALRFLLADAKKTPLTVYLMIPSSVPATPFDTNGAGEFLASDMAEFIEDENLLGLGELMCFHDVINSEPRALEKIRLFADYTRDGHAPGITCGEVQSYRLAGVNNDHECVNVEEALEKMRAGFNIYIREGSAARNLEPIIKGMLERKLPFEQCAFCTDDKHLADMESEGHIDHCVRKAIALGVPPVKAIKMATLYPSRMCKAKHIGAIGPRYKADILVVDNLTDFTPLAVLKNGKVIDDGFFDKMEKTTIPDELLDTVRFPALTPERIALKRNENNHVIGLVDNEIITTHLFEKIPGGEYFEPNGEYSKLCVIERHGKNGNVAVAPLKGFGIKNGAVASSVAHDSHNLIVAGDNDADIIAAANRIKELGGGYCVASGGKILAELPLGLCGLISTAPYKEIEKEATKILSAAHTLGVNPHLDPMITLSFVALPVIPSVRLLDTGLFDVDTFKMIAQN